MLRFVCMYSCILSFVWFGSFIGELCVCIIQYGPVFIPIPASTLAYLTKSYFMHHRFESKSRLSLYLYLFLSLVRFYNIFLLVVCSFSSLLPLFCCWLVQSYEHWIKCKHSENIVIAFRSWIRYTHPMHFSIRLSQIPIDKHTYYTIDDMRFFNTRSRFFHFVSCFTFQIFDMCYEHIPRTVSWFEYISVCGTSAKCLTWMKNNIYSMNKSMWLNCCLKCSE